MMISTAASSRHETPTQTAANSRNDDPSLHYAAEELVVGSFARSAA